MKVIGRLLGALAFGLLLCAAVLAALTAQDEPALAQGVTIPAQEDLPQGGFMPDGTAVNTTTQSAQTPSLAIRPGVDQPWVAFAQNNRVLVSALISDTGVWAQQDGALNRSLANVAEEPSLDFAGADRDEAWVAWTETVAGTPQIMAARFNGVNWALTAILNRDPSQGAGQPDLTAGSTVSGTAPLPWVVWAETGANESRQIVVSRAVADAGAQGGFAWQAVDGVLNLDPARNGANPELAFAGASNTQPWVVWQEEGGDQPTRIFAKRLVTNTWQSVGRQENCGTSELACALNLDPQRNATTPAITTGRLTTDTVPTPWIVFAETGANGQGQIQVMRLDVGAAGDADDRFVPVGGSVNAGCLGRAGLSGQGGAQPDIYFVGRVPHVAWIERQNGDDNLLVCHLADARPGQERWDLDTVRPINRTLSGTATRPDLSATATTPYVAWQEGGEQSNVYVAHRYPEGPAWGQNFPPFIQVITGSAAAALPPDLVTPAEVGQRSGPVLITTAAYHLEGWDRIDEVHFTLGEGEETIFLARYVVAENKVYVQDPDAPGVFFPGVTPGPGSPSIPTRYVSLATSLMRVTTHGDDSPTLDIQWALVFEDDAFLNSYVQALNILHDEGEETGFFQVGRVFVGQQTFLPLVANSSEDVAPNPEPALR